MGVYCDIELMERKERVESALVRLKSLKGRVTELREQCESLRKLGSEKAIGKVMCSECGTEIGLGQEVLVKDPSGKPNSSFHKECFKAIWTSESWKVGYSNNGLLRMSKDMR